MATIMMMIVYVFVFAKVRGKWEVESRSFGGEDGDHNDINENKWLNKGIRWCDKLPAGKGNRKACLDNI